MIRCEIGGMVDGVQGWCSRRKGHRGDQHWDTDKDISWVAQIPQSAAPLPPEPKRTTKKVRVKMQLVFHGDYVPVDDIEQRVNAWIDAGFSDRDDLRDWNVEVEKILEMDGDPMGYDS